MFAFTGAGELAALSIHVKIIWSKVSYLGITSVVKPVSPEPGSRVIYAHGPGFWVHAGYAYILMFFGTIWLVQAARNASGLFRRQAFALLAAALVPWFANLAYLFRLGPWPGLELTPIAFAFTGVVITWNLYRFQLLELAPVAREVLFDSLGDGVLVLDTQNRIVDVNPTAQRWMEVGDEVIGRVIFDVIPQAKNLQQNTLTESKRLPGKC